MAALFYEDSEEMVQSLGIKAEGHDEENLPISSPSFRGRLFLMRRGGHAEARKRANAPPERAMERTDVGLGIEQGQTNRNDAGRTTRYRGLAP